MSESGSYQSAASSRDCALQWVSIDLHDEEADRDEQHDCLDDIEEQIRSELQTVMRDGLLVAVQDGPNRAGRYVTERLKEAVNYNKVPKDRSEFVRRRTERRLDEKAGQVAELYDDLVSDVKRRAAVRSEAIFVDWGPVV